LLARHNHLAGWFGFDYHKRVVNPNGLVAFGAVRKRFLQ
jgi:hypothetical protein